MYVLSYLYQDAVLSHSGLSFFSLALPAIRPARRLKKDPSRVRKPLNSFMCFRKAFSKTLKAEKEEAARRQQDGSLPGEAVKRQEKDVSVDAGKVWSSMSAEEQAPYIKEADERKRLHEEKYPGLCGKGSSAGKKPSKTSKAALQKVRGRKGRKTRAPGDSAAVLGIPPASSSLHPGYGVPGRSVVATSSYAIPVPMSNHSFDHRNGWSSPSPSNDRLLLTPALTPSYTLSPSPGPSLYSFPPSANVSRVASPAVLDFTSDGTFYPDLPQAPVFAAPGEYLTVPEYQLYDTHPSLNGCAPLVPHHIGHAPYPAPLAVSNGAFPNQFAEQMIPIPPSLSLGTELAAAQVGYTWSGELVDQALLIPALDVAVSQDVQHLALQNPDGLGTSTPRSLDWWIAQLDPGVSFDGAVGSSDS